MKYSSKAKVDAISELAVMNDADFTLKGIQRELVIIDNGSGVSDIKFKLGLNEVSIKSIIGATAGTGTENRIVAWASNNGLKNSPISVTSNATTPTLGEFSNVGVVGLGEFSLANTQAGESGDIWYEDGKLYFYNTTKKVVGLISDSTSSATTVYSSNKLSNIFTSSLKNSMTISGVAYTNSVGTSNQLALGNISNGLVFSDVSWDNTTSTLVLGTVSSGINNKTSTSIQLTSAIDNTSSLLSVYHNNMNTTYEFILPKTDVDSTDLFRFSLVDSSTKYSPLDIMVRDINGTDSSVVEFDKYLGFRASGGNYTYITAHESPTSSVIYTLPENAGSDTYVLTTNGTGVLSWSPPAVGGAGGADDTLKSVSTNSITSTDSTYKLSSGVNVRFINSIASSTILTIADGPITIRDNISTLNSSIDTSFAHIKSYRPMVCEKEVYIKQTTGSLLSTNSISYDGTYYNPSYYDVINSGLDILEMPVNVGIMSDGRVVSGTCNKQIIREIIGPSDDDNDRTLDNSHLGTASMITLWHTHMADVYICNDPISLSVVKQGTWNASYLWAEENQYKFVLPIPTSALAGLSIRVIRSGPSVSQINGQINTGISLSPYLRIRTLGGSQLLLSDSYAGQHARDFVILQPEFNEYAVCTCLPIPTEGSSGAGITYRWFVQGSVTAYTSID